MDVFVQLKQDIRSTDHLPRKHFHLKIEILQIQAKIRVIRHRSMLNGGRSSEKTDQVLPTIIQNYVLQIDRLVSLDRLSCSLS